MLLPAVILLHLVASPYTKVEESFNIQATHDILTYGVPLRNASAVITNDFDHVDFPGSVPRTFVGSLLLAWAATPIAAWVSRPDYLQYVVRVILGLANALAIRSMKHAVDIAYGKAAGRWYVYMHISQFHIMYYASRTLPNMFGFALTTLAQRELILAKSVASRTPRSARRRKTAIYLLVMAGVIFRSEIAILLFAEVGYTLLRQRVSLIKEIVPTGLTAAAIAILFTVTMDSFFWQRFPLWPEWIGFYYNTIQGKSSEWGTSPFHFYFLDSAPRLLMNPMIYLVCLPAALTSKTLGQTSQDILISHLAFIAIYSLLPHKEWRFIVYSVPALTAVASSSAGWFWIRRTKSSFYRSLNLLMIFSTVLSFIASLGLLCVSSLNYPGGEALHRLHLHADQIGLNSSGIQDGSMNIYMGNLACQTGVTRFQQTRPHWHYDKTENQAILQDPQFWREFDYALVEEQEQALGDWTVVDIIRGFGGVSLRPGADDDLLPLPSVYPAILHSLRERYVHFAQLIKSRFTKGYWPIILMVPRIYIMANDEKLHLAQT